ncbi:hypothetical protein OG994_25620 [Micromonospora globbae]|uniref:Uncharacterized protein n=1 Tax=Micromonospora globbae TaxID=1894969 RepID=A0ABZ1S4R9_9ACTN|nr:hypothetical protein [Micromonospora globbae]
MSELTKLRESYAAACIRAVLNVDVEDGTDDGTLRRMYDLQIRYTDRPWAPVEVTSHLDEPTEAVLARISAEDGGIWSARTLNMRWSTRIRTDANVKKLRRSIEPALAKAERVGLDRVDDWVIRQLRRDLVAAPTDKIAEERLEAAQRLAEIGVASARASLPDLDGAEIWVAAGEGGGTWDGTGESIIGWLDTFMHDAKRSDLLKKYTHLPYNEAHIFIFVDINAVEFSVFRALYDNDTVPLQAPKLPPPYTHAWAVAAGSATGIRWDPELGWARWARPTARR